MDGFCLQRSLKCLWEGRMYDGGDVHLDRGGDLQAASLVCAYWCKSQNSFFMFFQWEENESTEMQPETRFSSINTRKQSNDP